MSERKGDWIQTSLGGQFWPLDPRPEEVFIEDIAHALANQCRFAGHCREFYSVAQHSVLVSLACHYKDALWGLLHDAAEAYLVDLARPLKPFLFGYRDAEARVMKCICQRFGLPLEQPSSVKYADECLLATEARDLMSPVHPDWSKWLSNFPTLPKVVVPLSPPEAKAFFLDRFFFLLEP